MSTYPSIPQSTYRLQFHKDFTFQHGRNIIPYLHALGITHVYASPIFKATPGSLHGYDICDHNQLNPELGTREDFEALAASIRSHGMGLIVDFVPNHMGIAEPENTWWMDVLENGPSSPFACFFDIDWKPLKRELKDKVLLPILGDQYGRVLEKGELQLAYDDGAFSLYYYQTRLPVSPRTVRPLLKLALDMVRGRINEDAQVEFESILTALEHLPTRIDTAPEKVAERARERQVIRRRLRTLCAEEFAVLDAIHAAVRSFSIPGNQHGFDSLDELITAQCFRLSYWRVAGEEINYRRFFDINTLAAIRMELPEVFDAAHQLIFSLLQEGSVSGLRIDHVDGLYDPQAYLENLQQRTASILDVPSEKRPLYLAVEKILGVNEHLRREWPVHGTTGYEFANQVISVLVDQNAEKTFSEIYHRFIDQHLDFHDIVYRSKLLVMRSAMSSEVNVLGSMLNRLSETNRWYRDFTLNSLTSAVREVIACFPVYRTYLTPEGEPNEDDRRVITRALATARRRNPAVERSVFDFLGEVLLPVPGNPHSVDEEERRRFVMKFQQCSGPITAKGVEDTAFYIYNRLVALNEVGGEPAIFGTSIETFHAQNVARLNEFPHCMLATSTHDTKRSEDVRARIAALSEIPHEWAQAVRRWHTANRECKRQFDGETAPDRNEEYLLYQVLLGSWPLEPMTKDGLKTYVERIQLYMEKAVREAKVNSSWIEPNQAWDEAVRDFVGSVLKRKRFLRSFEPMAAKIAQMGMVNALSQTVLKMTVPGAPDIYQGNETWDFSLVDPDNRRPVDYEHRQRLLAALDKNPNPADLVANWKDGRIKMFVTQRLLRLRSEHADLFFRGSYTPLSTRGQFATCCIAFSRSLDSQKLVVVVPRLTSRVGFPPLGDLWQDTEVEITGRLRNVLTGEQVDASPLKVSDALRQLPFAVFLSEI
ncbi:malto-oligosyltrehalose synthase [Verrucomicrobiota bacterium sgz303538]